MSRPNIPATLDCAHQIIYWLKLIDADGQRLSTELSRHISSGSLNELIAATYLDFFTGLSADLHQVQEAFDVAGMDQGTQLEIAAMVKTSYDYFKSMSFLLVDQLTDWGEDAELILKQARERHAIAAFH